MRKLKSFPVQVFCLIFGVVAIVWLIIQLVFFNSCLQEKESDTENSFSLCRKNQNYIYLKLLKLVRKKPECSKLLSELQVSLYPSINLPRIYIITPTYTRPVQKAELTRLSHTLLLVPKIHWIVVEDSENRTSLVEKFLKRSTLSYTHLNIPTPLPMKMKKEDPSWLKPKGVLQRNLALNYLRRHTSVEEKGVVYFADDDNTYDLDIFNEMRYTKTVSVWPVGIVGGLMVEKPLVKNGKVIGWNTVWKANRPFPIDMAGFAVNLTLLLEHPEAGFSLSIPRGYQESNILKNIVKIDQLEPKADNCTKVLVWHTRTQYPKLDQERKLSKPSNLNIEV